MDSINKLVKKINWDNDVVRVMEEANKKPGPIQFTYDRTINSLIEVCSVLVTRVDELSAMVEELSTPKKSKKKEEAKPEDA